MSTGEIIFLIVAGYFINAGFFVLFNFVWVDTNGDAIVPALTRIIIGIGTLVPYGIVLVVSLVWIWDIMAAIILMVYGFYRYGIAIKKPHSSVEEHSSDKRRVGGSSPPGATIGGYWHGG